jgi:hypothetical protein
VKSPQPRTSSFGQLNYRNCPLAHPRLFRVFTSPRVHGVWRLCNPGKEVTVKRFQLSLPYALPHSFPAYLPIPREIRHQRGLACLLRLLSLSSSHLYRGRIDHEKDNFSLAGCPGVTHRSYIRRIREFRNRKSAPRQEAVAGKQLPVAPSTSPA